jgi:hypothetical protein
MNAICIRIGTTGRHVKWKLPERDVEIPDLDDIESSSETKVTINTNNVENGTLTSSEAKEDILPDKEEVEKEDDEKKGSTPNKETTEALSRELDGKAECTQETVEVSGSTENQNEENKTISEKEDPFVRMDSNLDANTTTNEETKEQNDPMQETAQ